MKCLIFITTVLFFIKFTNGNNYCSVGEDDIIYKGDLMHSATTETYGECCKMCYVCNECNSFSWSNSTCFLNYDFGTPMSEIGAKSSMRLGYGYTNSTGSTNSTNSTNSTSSKSGSTCSAHKENNVNYVGNNLDQFKSSSYDECCDYCTSTVGCNAFTWTSKYDGVCYLKYKKGNILHQEDMYSSYLTDKIDYPVCTVYQHDVNFLGEEIEKKQYNTYKECCKYCSSVSDCTGYTWDGVYCILQKNINSNEFKDGYTSAYLI